LSEAVSAARRASPSVSTTTPGSLTASAARSWQDQLRTHAECFGVEILPAQAVSKITSMGDYRFVTTETGDEYCASAVIVATGSKYRRLNVPTS